MPIESFNPLFPISLLEPIKSIKSLVSSPGETEDTLNEQGEDKEKKESTKEKSIEVIIEDHNVGGEDNNGEHTRDIIPDNPYDDINPYDVGDPCDGGGSPWKIGTPERTIGNQNGSCWTMESRTQTKYSQRKLMK